MKKLLKLFKELEIELRAVGGIHSKILWAKLSKLTDWEYRIAQDFILRVKIAIQNEDMNFVFKRFENVVTDKNFLVNTTNKKVDLVIAQLKRDQADIFMTDARNRLLIPNSIRYEIVDIWGYMVTQARNIAVEQTLKLGAKYLLFIDDDIVAPNNALLKLYNLMKESNALVTSALYYKKIEPLEAPFEDIGGQIVIDVEAPIKEASKICGMGFCLLDIEAITNEVPLPLFWEFGAPDGYWSLGEDAFFTQNLVEYTNKAPLIDTSIKCIHIDKLWKRWYGEKDDTVVYASNIVDSLDKFNRIRVPPKFPSILICIPTRNENDHIAVDLNNLLLYRGYRSDLYRVWGYNVDEARNICAEEALRREVDYLLFIDDDIIPEKDGLNKLLDVVEAKSAKVVSGNYYLKGPDGLSVHTQLNSDGVVTAINRLEYENDIIVNNWLVGLGFCLIDTEVFKQARKPWFQCYSKNKDQKDINEDAHFCELCLDNGYTVYINMAAECLHVDFKKQLLYGNAKIDVEYAGNEALLSSVKLVNFRK